MCLHGRPVHAQTEPPLPDRNKYVFHVYVDSLFGDNAQATALNPDTTAAGGRMRPLGRHPEPPSPITGKVITGVLQQAPHAFKTLTGSTGALAYIATNFPGTPSSPTSMWWINPDYSERSLGVMYVVVHLLPGLYGPRGITGQPDVDPDSGLPYNGEVWPARITDRVSLQGVSALDTVLDGRKQNGFILDVTDPNMTTGPYSHLAAFIDSVTIRRARSAADSPPGFGAGIYMHSDNPGISATLFVSNCFITDNVVGIALNSYHGAPERPRILNNTIAWNAIGMWAGEVPVTTPPYAFSIHAPVVVNNIFDSGSPPGLAYIAGVSGFEGIHNQDKQVRTRNGVSVNAGAPLTGLDFNAWEVGRVNFGDTNASAVVLNWPRTFANTTPPNTPANGPRVDISPYTQGAVRGSLYVNDIFRNAGIGGLGANYSYNDFRLAPNVSQDQQPPTSLDPLVNQGIDDVGLAHPWSILMVNALGFADSPGLPMFSEGSGETSGSVDTPMNAWDWDCDGYGNRRIFLRPAPYGQGTYDGGDSVIDIGADEFDTLLMAGYLSSTRIYSDGAPQATFGNHTQVYFFNEISGGSYLRPMASAMQGRTHLWWHHVQTPGDQDAGNYTRMTTLPWLADRQFLMTLAPQFPYDSIVRSLECDFSGHVLPDQHPYWPIAQGSLHHPQTGVPYDIYACNPWHSLALPFLYKPNPPATRDNPAVYFNVGANTPGHNYGLSPYHLYGYVQTYVMDGTVNPPGTLVVMPGPTRLVGPVYWFGFFAPCSGGASYSIGPWGFGSVLAGCPDVVPNPTGPGWSGTGIRYNCEPLPLAGLPNLQTFLAITDTPIPGLKAGPQSQGKFTMSKALDREALESLVKSVTMKKK